MYTEEQVYNVLTKIGVDIAQETMTDWVCYCPVHGNTDSPAFAVSKDTGVFICYNPSCDVRGNLKTLIKMVTKKDETATEILLAQCKRGISSSTKAVQRMLKKQEFVRFPNEKMLERLSKQLWEDDKRGLEYMRSRGFEDETLLHFEVGYSSKRNMVTVPMHDPNGMPVGFIGRSASNTDKTFKNSPNLPSSLTLWNLHRAKKTGGTLIINEASFDSMRVHQAGFPNVAASLGGYWNDHRRDLVDKYFNTIIIMTDDDRLRFQTPCRKCMNNGHKRCLGHLDGEALGLKIADSLPYKRVKWAMGSDVKKLHNKRLYSKDGAGMTDAEIRDCILNAVPHIEYIKTAHTLLAS